MHFDTLTGLITLITNIILAAVPVFAALALLYFFWGIAELILNAGDADKLKSGRTRMIWGVITLFVILSLGGLVSVVSNTFFGSAGGSGENPYSHGTIPQGSGHGIVTTPGSGEKCAPFLGVNVCWTPWFPGR